MHRDVGYLAVGLTFVYAGSGLAVNHIADPGWDPNFVNYDRTETLGGPLSADDRDAAATVLAQLGIDDQPADVFRVSDTELEVVLDQSTLHVDSAAGTITVEGQRPRPLLRVANWLHLNRGKQAWTYVADGYALFLLFLATSGVFMLPGRKGLRGRGAVLVGVGVALPILYVVLSGGP